MSALESDIQGSIMERGEGRGAIVVKMNPGVAGVPKGFPDLLVIRADGDVDFVEVKRPGEEPTRIQSWWHQQIEKRRKRPVVVADDVDDVFP